MFEGGVINTMLTLHLPWRSPLFNFILGPSHVKRTSVAWPCISLMKSPEISLNLRMAEAAEPYKQLQQLGPSKNTGHMFY